MIRTVFLLAVFLFTLPACFRAGQVQNRHYREIENRAFTKGPFTYIPLGQGFRHPNSAWGSIGITREGLVYVIVCNHITDAAIYEYNTNNDKLHFLGRLKDHFHHRFHFQRQPKVHTPLLQYNKDGLVYFGTDAGDMSEDALRGHFNEGYSGGSLACLDPVSKAVRNLGLVHRMGGTKSLALDQQSGRLYFTVSPTSNLCRYDINTGKLSDLGRICGYKVVRTLFLDRWGNVYGTTESDGLVRYNAARDTMEYMDIVLKGGCSQVAYGPDRSYIISYGGYTGNVFKYYPDSAGNGRLEELGALFQEKGIMARNLNVADGKMYVLCTSVEEIPGKERFRYFAVYDLNAKKIVKRVDVAPFIHQAYGHPVVDKNGNRYLCGFWDASDYDLPEDAKDRVYLIKFNPKSL